MPRTRSDVPDVPGVEAPDEPTMTEDDATSELARLGQALIATAGDKRKQQQVAQDLESLLAKLTPKDFPQLADNPAVLQFLESMAHAKAEGSDDPPGTIYNRGSVAVHSKPWTWNDLKSPPPGWVPGTPLPRGSVEWVYNYRPQRTTPVTWNGLTVQFFARQPWTGPKVFVDVLDEGDRLEQVAHEHAAFMFKNGGLPSDPGVINEGTRRVRAASSAGGVGSGFRPGAGVGAAFFAGMQPAEGEDETDAA
jgi:hypothetical protein